MRPDGHIRLSTVPCLLSSWRATPSSLWPLRLFHQDTVRLALKPFMENMLHDFNVCLHPTVLTTADPQCMGVAGDAPQALSIRRRPQGGTTGGSPQCQIPLGLTTQIWPLRSIRGPRHSADPLPSIKIWLPKVAISLQRGAIFQHKSHAMLT